MAIDLSTAIPQVFSDSQRSTAGHRKNAAALKKIHQRTAKSGGGGENNFNAEFVRNLNKVLPIRKGQIVADRVIKFVAEYLKFIVEKDRDGANGSVPNNEADSLAHRFVTFLLQYLLKGVAAKDKNVRMRVSQLLAESIDALQEIDEDLYLQLKSKILVMLKEKDAVIRAQAVRAVAGLQASRITPARSDVRRSIVNSIMWDETTKLAVLERLRDVDNGVRKAVYARIMENTAEMFEGFSLEQRERIFSVGLKDRDPAVKKACIALLTSWLNASAEGNIEKLLQMLDVTNTSVTEDITRAAITAAPTFSLSCNEEFWDSLSGESVFLLRVYGNSINQELPDNVFPSLSELVGYVQRYHSLRLAATTDEDVIIVDFIVAELLKLALILDYADEVGRKNLFAYLRDMCLEPDLSDSHVPLIVAVIAKTAASGKDFARVVVELIKEIMDFDVEGTGDGDAGDEAQLQRLLSIVKSLVILRSALEQTEEMLSGMPTLGAQLADLVIPAITSEDETLKDLGLHCLALYCTIDRDLAIKNLATFTEIGRKDDNSTLLCVKACIFFGSTFSLKDSRVPEILQTVCDLLALYSTSAFDVNVRDSACAFLILSSDNQDEQVASFAVEGLAKLLLLGVINDRNILEKLALIYFDPSEDRRTRPRERQCLSFFFEAYSHSSASNQENIGAIAGSVFSKVLQESELSELRMSPLQIGLQLLDWADSSKLVDLKTSQPKIISSQGDAQGQVAVDLLKIPFRDQSNIKVIAQLLTKVNVSQQWNREQLEKATLLVGNVRKLVPDVASTNNLKKFAAALSGVQEKLPPLTEDENSLREQWNDELNAFCKSPVQSKRKDDRKGTQKRQPLRSRRAAQQSQRRVEEETSEEESEPEEFNSDKEERDEEDSEGLSE
ncbi:hypothetical protein HDU93_003825 [Gonapodya sp. JEL0774]|nr:hypothetical protein HDU93_003825 [Gonapodya sp. JEL0774]